MQIVRGRAGFARRSDGMNVQKYQCGIRSCDPGAPGFPHAPERESFPASARRKGFRGGEVREKLLAPAIIALHLLTSAASAQWSSAQLFNDPGEAGTDVKTARVAG